MKFTASAIVACAFLLQDAAGRVIERATATPVKNSGKRGLSFNNPAYTMPFSLSGQNSQVSWAYNWYQTPGNGFNPALDYVPMLWSDASDLTGSWASNAQAAINSGSKHLLGFNEPDLCVAGAGASCMQMSSAVKAWKQYMEPFAGKALLGSPAVTNGGSPMGLTWLQNFMGNCTGCHIDFINIHWYSNKWAGANYFKQQVQAAHAMSGGRPVWVTEFGLNNEYAFTAAELSSFLEEVMEWMDEQPYVQRYAYFMDTTNMLMNSDGTGMSDLGSTYNSYPEVSFASSSFSASATAVPSVPSSASSSASATPLPATTSTYTSSRTTNAPTKALTNVSSTNSSSETFAISSPLSSSSSTKSVLSTSSSMTVVKAATTTASAPTPRITILSAFFADKDVTAAASTAFVQNGELVVDTNTLASALGISDPWWGTVKTISILYSDNNNNNATYIFSQAEQSGVYTITASAIPASASTPVISPSQGSDISIIAVVWGKQQINTLSVFERLYYQRITNWGFRVDTALFGLDGFWGHEKVGVVWYRDGAGRLKALVAREGGWVKF